MTLPDSVRTLERDLRAVFGNRLRSLVAYNDASDGGASFQPTLAVVEDLSADDLRACADRVASWHDAGLDTPLLLGRQEFARSLDAFPYEFGAILSDHVVVTGEDPFEGLRVDPAHLRHACEIQARSHLLHLREGYLETRGRSDRLADLIVRSAAPFAALVKSVARLLGDKAADAAARSARIERELGVPAGSIAEIVRRSSSGSISSDEAKRIFPAYLEAVERLTRHIDRWNAGNVR
jgi:hypothetical protein